MKQKIKTRLPAGVVEKLRKIPEVVVIVVRKVTIIVNLNIATRCWRIILIRHLYQVHHSW